MSTTTVAPPPRLELDPGVVRKARTLARRPAALDALLAAIRDAVDATHAADLLARFDAGLAALRADLDALDADPATHAVADRRPAQSDLHLTQAIAANADTLPSSAAGEAFLAAAALVDDLPVERMTLVTRAFAAYFHLANICEENYRREKLRERERVIPAGHSVTVSTTGAPAVTCATFQVRLT